MVPVFELQHWMQQRSMLGNKTEARRWTLGVAASGAPQYRNIGITRAMVIDFETQVDN